jgi:flagellar hook assembly protein FlgD
VRTLLADAVTAGEHRVAWDGNDDAGRPAPSGLYFARFRIGSAAASTRLLVLR